MFEKAAHPRSDTDYRHHSGEPVMKQWSEKKIAGRALYLKLFYPALLGKFLELEPPSYIYFPSSRCLKNDMKKPLDSLHAFSP